jgi:hypothetical protein
VVEYHPVYHWEKVLDEKEKKAHIRVFDTQEDRELKKVGYYIPDESKAGTMYAPAPRWLCPLVIEPLYLRQDLP